MLITLIYVTIFILILISLLLYNVHFTLKKNIQKLFSSVPEAIESFHLSQLNGLPVPVQQYFKHVLKPGQQYITSVRLKHSGLFKSSEKDKWEKIKGVQYFTVSIPGFIWKGKTSLFTAVDMLLDGKGRLSVFLFSFLKILHGKGEKYDQGELIRWLGESVWFPTNLLPGKNLRWLEKDALHATLHYDYNGTTISYLVSFNEKNEIISMETNRYKGSQALQKWIGKYAEYKTRNGMLIPTIVEGAWVDNEAEDPYAIFELLEIDVNIPQPY